MSKKEEIKKIWSDCFDMNRKYVDLYFNDIYIDEEALMLEDATGGPVSCMMLEQHKISFHGYEANVSYISGAATKRAKRGQGFMSQLMRAALEESADRGDMLCTLIPTSEALYYFFRRYGFSTVFFTKEQRYTAFHSFAVEGDYYPLTDAMSDEVWEAFDKFQHERKSYILHDRKDFNNILADLKIHNGTFVVMATDDEEGTRRIVSMAWGLLNDDLLTVLDVMGESRDTRAAALRQLRGYYGDTPVFVYGHPDQSGGRLQPRGMGRLVNVRKALEIVAKAYPKFKCHLRIADRLLSEVNSHIFYIEDGEAGIDDDYTGHLDFDVDIDVMTEILFSCDKIGDIINFPTVRPMISLMHQ